MKENMQKEPSEQRSRMSKQFMEKKVSLVVFRKVAKAFKLMNTAEEKEMLASRIADEMEKGLQTEKLAKRAMEISRELLDKNN